MCPCPDERRSDPRIPLHYGSRLWPPIDPRGLGLLSLHLSTSSGERWTGSTFVIDNNYTAVGSAHHVVKACPSSMVEFCPLVNVTSDGEILEPHYPSPALRCDDHGGAWSISHLPSLLAGVGIGLVCGLLLSRRTRRRSRANGAHENLLSSQGDSNQAENAAA